MKAQGAKVEARGSGGKLYSTLCPDFAFSWGPRLAAPHLDTKPQEGLHGVVRVGTGPGSAVMSATHP